ncbi:PD-(D/E)XK nuclease family protein [Candidatus Obscuribacterales bacterium]|nr:PD-(D/E)XK nuclease family protein [Candidatus Obscuribacterales bacterium]
MELNITFGWHLDGPSFPEEPGLGQLTAGPIGMLNQLCLRLGLMTRYPAQAVRIAQYLSLLKATDDGSYFYSQSLKTDSWGTAKAMLSLRDDLLANGWKPLAAGEANVDVPARLAAISQIEKIAGNKLICLTDMIGPILDALDSVDDVKISSISILDGIELLPPIWQKLFLKLESKNVQIKEWFGCDENSTPISEDVSEELISSQACTDKGLEPSSMSDVAKLGAFLNANEKLEFSADGSLLILESDDEVQAADYIANLLPQLAGQRQTVIIRGASTSFLDKMLKRQNLPAIGGPRKSALRGYLQLLPLALELLWEPLDPVRMIEFLLLPHGPIPPSIARSFTYALSREPGIGGSAWGKAWSDTREQLKKWQAEDKEELFVCSEAETAVTEPNSEIDNLQTNALLARELSLKKWLESERFDISSGIPSSVVLDLCRRVKQHAHLRLNTVFPESLSSENLVFLQTAACAETLASTVTAMNVESISRSQLMRIIESVMGEGYSPDNPEASEWSSVDHPGQITAHADTVIWWGFVDNEKHGFTTPWSSGESAYLESLGVHVDTAQSAVVREAKSWCRPISTCAKQLLLVKPRAVAGRTVAAHPFYHEISAALEFTPHRTRSTLIKQAHQIYEGATTDCLNICIKSEMVKHTELPSRRPRWNISAHAIEPSIESATSLQRLLGCPLNWMLEHKAKFKFGHLLSISAGEQLAGNLAHAVFARVFNDAKSGASHSTHAVQAAQAAQKYFDELCPKVAAPLLLPGNSLERQRLRQAVVEGADSLARMIDDANFSKVICEVEENITLDGVSLTGRPDMVLIHPDNVDYVIDLKWTRRAPYRRREISEGRAIQLALYATLINKGSGLATEGGYFMIAQKQLYSTSAKLFPEHMYVEGLSLRHTFANVLQNYKTHLELLNDGTIYATGLNACSNEALETDEGGIDIYLDDEPEHPSQKVPGITLALEPPCRICNFARLCGYKEYQS